MTHSQYLNGVTDDPIALDIGVRRYDQFAQRCPQYGPPTVREGFEAIVRRDQSGRYFNRRVWVELLDVGSDRVHLCQRGVGPDDFGH